MVLTPDQNNSPDVKSPPSVSIPFGPGFPGKRKEIRFGGERSLPLTVGLSTSLWGLLCGDRTGREGG